MRIKDKILRIFSIAVFFLIALIFVARFGGPNILRLYIDRGIGDCQRLPILCMAPVEEITNPKIDKEYIAQLLPQEFPKMQIYIPKDVTVIKGSITKVYYEKKIQKRPGSVIYLLHKKPNFFINLFPQLNKQGIRNDYEFLTRLMYAKTKNIKNLTDTFFVITKSIFTPNLGEQRDIKMIRFTINDKKGFINFNISTSENYFDCNIIISQGDFFKIYIKDKAARLDLDKVFAIISTIKIID